MPYTLVNPKQELWMSRRIILIFLILAFYSFSAFSFGFGDLDKAVGNLNAIVEAVKQDAGKATSSNKVSGVLQKTNGGNLQVSVDSLDQACLKIENNETAQLYSAKIKKIIDLNEKARKFGYAYDDSNFINFNFSFDTDDLLYSRLYDQKKINFPDLNKYLTYCAVKFRNSHLSHVFMSGGQNGAGLKRLYRRIDRDLNLYSPKPFKKLDEEGNITEITPEMDWNRMFDTRHSSNSKIFRLYDQPPSRRKTQGNNSDHPVFPSTILTGGDKIVSNVGKSVLARLDKLEAELSGVVSRFNDRKKKAKIKEQEQAKKARIKKQEHANTQKKLLKDLLPKVKSGVNNKPYSQCLKEIENMVDLALLLEPNTSQKKLNNMRLGMNASCGCFYVNIEQNTSKLSSSIRRDVASDLYKLEKNKIALNEGVMSGYEKQRLFNGMNNAVKSIGVWDKAIRACAN